MRDVVIRISAVDKATSVISRIQGNINKSIERINKATEKFQSSMEKVANMKLAADGVNSFADSVKNSLTAPVQAGMEFEAMMSKVAAISLTGFLDEQGNKTVEYEQKLQSLTQTAQEWGAKTAWSASQIAEGFSYLGMAGFSPEQIEAATGGMLNAASAAGIGLGETADILSNIGSAMFGKDAANQFNRMADVMTHVTTSSNSDLIMLGEAMKYAAPIAATAGVNFETLSGSMAKLHDVGIQSSMAGTVMRASLSRLSAPPKAAAEALEKLGVSTVDASGNLRDFPTILKEISDATERLDMGSAEKVEAFAKIAGLEAASGFSELVKQAGSGDLQKYIAQMGDAGQAVAGKADQVSQTMLDNLKGRVTILGSVTEALYINVFNAIKPTLTDFVARITTVVGAINDWITRNPQLAGTIFKIITGLGALAAGIGATITTIAGLTAVIATLKLGLVGIAAFSAPLLALGTVGLLIYKYWQPLQAIFQGVASGLSSLFSPIASTLSPLASKLKPIYDFFVNLLNPVQLSANELEKFKTIGHSIGVTLGGFITTSGLSFIGTFANGITQGGQLLWNAIVSLFNFIRPLFPFSPAKAGPLSTIKGESLITAFADGVKKAGSYLWNAVVEVFNKISFPQIGQTLYPTLKAFVFKLFRGDFITLTASAITGLTGLAIAAPFTEKFQEVFADAPMWQRALWGISEGILITLPTILRHALAATPIGKIFAFFFSKAVPTASFRSILTFIGEASAGILLSSYSNEIMGAISGVDLSSSLNNAIGKAWETVGKIISGDSGFYEIFTKNITSIPQFYQDNLISPTKQMSISIKGYFRDAFEGGYLLGFKKIYGDLINYILELISPVGEKIKAVTDFISTISFGHLQISLFSILNPEALLGTGFTISSIAAFFNQNAFLKAAYSIGKSVVNVFSSIAKLIKALFTMTFSDMGKSTPALTSAMSDIKTAGKGLIESFKELKTVGKTFWVVFKSYTLIALAPLLKMIQVYIGLKNLSKLSEKMKNKDGKEPFIALKSYKTTYAKIFKDVINPFNVKFENVMYGWQFKVNALVGYFQKIGKLRSLLLLSGSGTIFYIAWFFGRKLFNFLLENGEQIGQSLSSMWRNSTTALMELFTQFSAFFSAVQSVISKVAHTLGMVFIVAIDALGRLSVSQWKWLAGLGAALATFHAIRKVAALFRKKEETCPLAACFGKAEKKAKGWRKLFAPVTSLFKKDKASDFCQSSTCTGASKMVGGYKQQLGMLDAAKKSTKTLCETTKKCSETAAKATEKTTKIQERHNKILEKTNKISTHSDNLRKKLEKSLPKQQPLSFAPTLPKFTENDAQQSLDFSKKKGYGIPKQKIPEPVKKSWLPKWLRRNAKEVQDATKNTIQPELDFSKPKLWDVIKAKASITSKAVSVQFKKMSGTIESAASRSAKAMSTQFQKLGGSIKSAMGAASKAVSNQFKKMGNAYEDYVIQAYRTGTGKTTALQPEINVPTKAKEISANMTKDLGRGGANSKFHNLNRQGIHNKSMELAQQEASRIKEINKLLAEKNALATQKRSVFQHIVVAADTAKDSILMKFDNLNQGVSQRLDKIPEKGKSVFSKFGKMSLVGAGVGAGALGAGMMFSGDLQAAELGNFNAGLQQTTQSVGMLTQLTNTLGQAWTWVTGNWETILSIGLATGLLDIGAVLGTVATAATSLGSGILAAVTSVTALSAGFAALLGFGIGTWLYNEFSIVRETAINVVGYFVEAGANIKNAVMSGWNILTELTGVMGSALSYLMTLSWSEAGSLLLNTMSQGITNTAASAQAAVNSVIQGISSWLGQQSWYKQGASMVQTWMNGVKSVHQAAKNQVTKLFESIDYLMNHSDAKEGPLSNVSGAGKSFVQTWSGGVGKEGGTAKKVTQSMLAGVAGVLMGTAMPSMAMPQFEADALKQQVMTGVDSTVNALKQQTIDAPSKLMAGLFDGDIGGALTGIGDGFTSTLFDAPENMLGGVLGGLSVPFSPDTDLLGGALDGLGGFGLTVPFAPDTSSLNGALGGVNAGGLAAPVQAAPVERSQPMPMAQSGGSKTVNVTFGDIIINVQGGAGEVDVEQIAEVVAQRIRSEMESSFNDSMFDIN